MPPRLRCHDCNTANSTTNTVSLCRLDDKRCQNCCLAFLDVQAREQCLIHFAMADDITRQRLDDEAAQSEAALGQQADENANGCNEVQANVGANQVENNPTARQGAVQAVPVFG